MSEEAKKKKMEQDVKAVLQHIREPALKLAANAHEWEQIVDAKDGSPEEKQKLRELGRFLSLKQYFEDKGQLLEQVVIDGFLELHRFPLNMQITWLSNVNRKLMERVDDAGARA